MSALRTDQLLDAMSLEQLVGQCFVIGLSGSMVTPALRRRIRTWCPAGLRVAHNLRVKTALYDPYATGLANRDKVLRQPGVQDKDFLKGLTPPSCSCEEYCGLLNSLKQETLECGGIPLHITLDMEGNESADFCRGGCHYFPHPLGLARSGDPSLAYDVAKAIAAQLVPVGFNWIHSPVLDVNTESLNPEISTRSYGQDPETVIQYARASLKGFMDGGLIATGKHFPGRGASREDAHTGLPVIRLSREELTTQHLAAFKGLIDAGLPAIMSAHTSYPALDPSGRPATLSKSILTGVLREELGFQGVVTTDEITMGGILENFTVPEACVEAILAGADLILIRDEGGLLDEVLDGVYEAARSGRLPEERLREAVGRTLHVKQTYGLFAHGNLKDVERASSGMRDKQVARTARRSAEACVEVLRDRAGILPLTPGMRVLLVEQVPPLHHYTNDFRCHPGLLWESMCRHSDAVGMVETAMDHSEQDKERVRARLDQADVIVATHYYYRRGESRTNFIQELNQLDKPLVVVTNNSYPLTVCPEMDTVVVTYGLSPESMEAVADRVFGINAGVRSAAQAERAPEFQCGDVLKV